MNKSHKDKSIYDKITHPKTILTALTRMLYFKNTFTLYKEFYQ